MNVNIIEENGDHSYYEKDIQEITITIGDKIYTITQIGNALKIVSDDYISIRPDSPDCIVISEWKGVSSGSLNNPDQQADAKSGR